MTTAPVHHPSLWVILGIAGLVSWRLYQRIRRLVGRQRLGRVRPWLAATLFPLLAVGLLASTRFAPLPAGAELTGLALGIALGAWGLRLTRFEVTPGGRYYTPNAHIGIALSLLIVVRIGWRFAQIALAGDAPTADTAFALGGPDAFVRSPLTLALFGMLAGYYATYAIGLLRWRHRVPAPAP